MKDTNFDGCRRECRIKGEHTRTWGGCEFGVEPEPTVSMSMIYTDPSDGYPSIGTDDYNLQQLTDLIEPAVRRVKIQFGPNSLAVISRGATLGLSGGESAAIAREVAYEIIHRNDKDRTTPAPANVPVEHPFGVGDCTCTPWMKVTPDDSEPWKAGDDPSRIPGWRRGIDCPLHDPDGGDPTCGKTTSVDGTHYPPCTRQPEHVQAYCRDRTHQYYFLARSNERNAP